jgi:hypothetical protein
MANEEIFYLLAYDKRERKWRSADETLSMLVHDEKGEGPVRVMSDDGSVVWRDIKDGQEKDIDFENAEILSSFLRDLNS